MVFITRLGLRNVLRHKKRTLVTAILISLAIFIYLISDSLVIGLEQLSIKSLVELETGHLQVVTSEYWEEKEEMPLENLLTESEQLKDQIKSLDDFAAISPQLRFSANLNNGIDELPVMGLGVKPAAYQEVFAIEKYMVEGNFFTAGQYQAVLGKSLADLMELQLGDYLTLLIRTKEGTFNTIDAEIVGLLSTPNPNINNNTVLVPLDIARKSLNLEKQASQVIIRFNTDRQQALEKVDILSKKLIDNKQKLEVYSWKESAQSVIAMMEAQNAENAIVLGIIILIAAVGIINTTILSSIERMEETGMMKALGLKEGEIIRAFMVEAAGIGLIGGVIGCILGGIGVALLTNVGLAMSVFGGAETDFGIPIVDRIYGGWNPGAFVFIFIFGVMVAILSSILPARWAARKDAVKAIYHR